MHLLTLPQHVAVAAIWVAEPTGGGGSRGMGLLWGYIGVFMGLYWDNGKMELLL